jgi:hypothetical protein
VGTAVHENFPVVDKEFSGIKVSAIASRPVGEIGRPQGRLSQKISERDDLPNLGRIKALISFSKSP